MEHKHYFLFNFDKTFVTPDTIEELARHALKSNPDRQQLLEEITEISRQQKAGELLFQEAFTQIVRLATPTRKHINTLASSLQKQLTPSLNRNKIFFEDCADQIYVFSRGFKDYILPVLKGVGIKESHVIAFSCAYDSNGLVTGYAADNIAEQDSGITGTLKSLNLDGEIVVIGNSPEDYRLKELGLAKTFVAFTENCRQEEVVKVADFEAPNFDEFLFRFKLPRAHSYPKTRMKVLLLEKIDRKGADFFEKQGYEVKTYDRALSEEELCREIKNVSILGIRSKTEITKEVLENANRLLSIGAFCIGTNQINLPAASRKGVAVFNAPYSNTRSVVELTLGEIIMLTRNVFEKSQKMHRGIWDKSAEGSHEIRGKKLGIIGYGNIGSQLSVLAESMGLVVYFYDVVDKLALGNARPCHSIEELLQISDIVSVHVDGRKSNQNLIGAREFKLMKPGTIFLNASRGSVVDIKALVQAINSKTIRGAAIDVFPEEPRSNSDPFVNELQNLPNVILTPHIAGSTLEAQQNIADFVSNKLSNFIDNGDTTLSVNFPNLNLPLLVSGHRFIHVHSNVPGILAQINSILARHDFNIIGQYLKTNEEIGYVITDVSSSYSDQAIDELVNIQKTIKFRVLF
jgi:D-3-phosphoglycerate dehydrogenase